jgi:phosphatidylglycerol:prolipoprotein diacylglycerol transferase
MYNDWFTIGNFTIHGYGVMIAVGILMAFYVGEKLARKTGLDPDFLDTLIFTCLISGYIGSKLLYILTIWDQFLADPGAAFRNGGGWVVYGGILGGILGAWILCRVKKKNFPAYLNLGLVITALAQGFGRIGCFFAGCCYGKPTNGALGITFTHSDYAINGVRLYPTQPLMAAGDFVLFYILYKVYMDEQTRDETAAWYLILYSFGRFVIEFLRGDTERGFIGSLSTSQFISIFTFAAGLLLLAAVKRRHVGKELVAGAQEEKK